MKLKKKLKKIIAILSAVVIAFSCFIIPVSAVATNDMYRFTMPLAQPTYSEHFAFLEIMYNDNKDAEVLLISLTCPDDYDIYYDDLYLIDNCIVIDVFQDHIVISPKSSLASTGYELGVYYVNTNGETNFKMGHTQPISRYYNIINGFHVYGVTGVYENTGVDNNPNFVCIYGSDSMAYAQLKTIVSLLQRNNKDIIANADKNASEIQQNQDDNTNKVINGGTDDPHYTENDKTATDNYHQKEEEIFNGTASARDSTVSMFNNFGNLIESGKLKKGLLVVSRILSQVFAIGWLANLVQFALALGAFSFIIGSVTLVVGKISSNKRAETRSNYYKAKTEYYNSRRKK